MWSVIVRVILRNRILILSTIFVLTGIMVYNATRLQMDYEMVQMLPEDHPVSAVYNDFKELFGQDAAMMVIGMQDTGIYSLEVFQKYYDLTRDIGNLYGVDTVLSIAKLYTIEEDSAEGSLRMVNVLENRPKVQHDVDTLFQQLKNLRFYDGFLFRHSDKGFVHLMAITLNPEHLNTKVRIELVNEIVAVSSQFTEVTGVQLHYSGMPYIRTHIMAKVKREVTLFIGLAALVLAIILYLFFRSFRVVAVSLLIVGIAVTWVLGTMSLFGFKITILTAMIPPLIIVIGIPNCIYLLNKYHREYKNHGNKILALSRVIQRVGNATLMTNMTTAVGFATFIIVRADVLKQFGLVASLNIFALYLISLTLITIIFSYLPAPTDRHIKHLENAFFRKVVSKLVRMAIDQRKYVYYGTALILIITAIGITRISTSGNVVDDIPENDPVYKDLMFFEQHFTGVLPFELKIDTRHENGVFDHNGRTLYLINRLYKALETDSQFSNYLSTPLSVINGISFVNQIKNNNDPQFYLVPTANELLDMQRFVSDDKINTNAFKPFIDSTHRYTRVTLQMANISSGQISDIRDSLEPLIATIFNPPRWYNTYFEEEEPLTTLIEEFATYGNADTEAKTSEPVAIFTADQWNNWSKIQKDSLLQYYTLPEAYDVTATGMAVVFLEGTGFLLRNLFQSLGLAILLIAVFMIWLFRSSRMVMISLIPNIIPLLFTGAVMGYAGIPIKPSTILVFSIAFGISVDNAIHLLAKYRQELRLNKGNRRKSVVLALRETGFSMLYTSITLFFGFAIFIASGFGGTQAMGILVSITLLLAMVTNLLLLPTLILTLERVIQTKEMKQARFQIYDDDEAGKVEELEPELRKLIRRRRRKKLIRATIGKKQPL
jgi:uncharacterized protein